MVLEEKASLEADLADEGTHLAELRLLAPQNEAYWVDELTSGVSYLQFVRHLSSELDDRLSEICRTFEEIRSRLVSADHMVFHFTAETQDGDACMEQIAGLMDRLPVAGRNETVWQRPTERVSAGFVIQSQVGYVSKLANVFELGFSRHGSSNVVCHHLENTWLWEQIRARGGAYDCSCRLRDGTGALYMSSFRDPDPVASVAGFDGSGRFLRETDLDPEALARSIIGTVGELDTYQLPDAKGYTSLLNFLVGRTDQVRQQTRDEILATGTDDFRHMAGVFDLAATAGAIVVFGPEQVIRRANRAWDNRIKVERLQ